MAVEKLAGKMKIVATKVIGSAQGLPPFHVMAEVYFPSLEALEKCAASEGGKGDVNSRGSYLYWRQSYLPGGRRAVL